MNASYNTCVLPPQDRSYVPSPCPAYPAFPDGSLLSYLRKVTHEEAPQESRPGSISEPYSFGKNLLTISNLAEKTTGNNNQQHPPQQQSFKVEFHRHTEDLHNNNVGEEEEEEQEEPEKGLVDLVVTPSALATYTMTTLRQYIRMKGISPAGKRKQELIAAILEVCGDSSRLERDVEGQRGAESHSEDSNSDGSSEGRPRRRRRVTTHPAAIEKSPIKKRRKQPTVAAAKKKKGTPHTKREGPLPMILNDKGELVYDRHAHLRNRENGSCHRCKNKKKMNVVCPFAKSHLFCRACVERHCGFDFDDMKNNVEKHWSTGCPVCRGDCDCAYCKRTRKAGVSSYTPAQATTSTTLVAPSSVAASNIKRGLKRKSPEKKVVRQVEDEEEPEEVEDDVRMFLRSLKSENSNEEEEGGDQSSPFTPKRQPYRRAAAGRKKRRGSAEEYFVEEQQPQQPQHQDGIVRVTPAVIKKDGHYELLEKEASVEAFVGLTGAGSVLMSRHRTTIPLPADD